MTYPGTWCHNITIPKIDPTSEGSRNHSRVGCPRANPPRSSGVELWVTDRLYMQTREPRSSTVKQIAKADPHLV